MDQTQTGNTPSSPQSRGLGGAHRPLDPLQAEARSWSAWPMGPKLLEFLELPADATAGAPQPNPDSALARAGFLAFLDRWLLDRAPRTPLESLIDVLDELVSMDLPEAALGLAGVRPDLASASDFRAPFGLGVAAMVTGNLENARDFLESAHRLAPAEPAPYINLAMIEEALGRLDEAESWCRRGLEGERNNLKLWDIIGRIWSQRHGEQAASDRLTAEAGQRRSWAGLSLALSLSPDGDPGRKAALMEPFFAAGEASDDFLVEYTAALGIAGQFESLLRIITDTESLRAKAETGQPGSMPWQLHAHAAQALLVLDRRAAALDRLQVALTDPWLPEPARAALEELKAEAEAPDAAH